MELKNSTVAELNQLKRDLNLDQFSITIKFIDGKLQSLKKSTYLECLQFIADLDPRKVNIARVINPHTMEVNLIDPDELQLWRSNREHYRIEVRYCNHHKDEWIMYPNLITGYENAKVYQPGDFYERLRIKRLYDGKIVMEEESRVFKLFYSDGHYDFVTNCSYRMAESIGKVRCNKNGTDFGKLIITETSRKSK